MPWSIEGKPRPTKDEIDAFLEDEIDALPANLRYSNFDFLCTIISILTYLFDLVSVCIETVPSQLSHFKMTLLPSMSVNRTTHSPVYDLSCLRCWWDDDDWVRETYVTYDEVMVSKICPKSCLNVLLKRSQWQSGKRLDFFGHISSFQHARVEVEVEV